jgi:hypothetical protein
MGYNPLLGIHHKNCPVTRQTFTSSFLQAAVAGPFLGIDFLRKFRITVAPQTRDQLNHVFLYGDGRTRRQTLSALFF